MVILDLLSLIPFWLVILAIVFFLSFIAVLFILWKYPRELDIFLKQNFNIRIDFLAKIYNFDKSKSDIFFDYHHETIDEWLEWMINKDISLQKKALAKFIDYIYSDPMQWDSKMVDLVRALGVWNVPESLMLLRDIILISVKILYRDPRYHDIAIKASTQLVRINPKVSLSFMNDFISSKVSDPFCYLLFAEVFSDFPVGDEALYKPSFETLMCDDIGYDKRNKHFQAAMILYSSNQYAYLNKFSDYLLDLNLQTLSKDTMRLLKQIFGQLMLFVTDDNFTQVQSLCEEAVIRRIVFEVIAATLQEEKININYRNIYWIYQHAQSPDDRKIIHKLLAQKNNLSYQELQLSREANPLEVYPFTTKPLVIEKSEDEITLPEDLYEFRQVVIDSLSSKISYSDDGESVEGGGILLTGNAETEKIFTARSIASKKSWKFVYVDFYESSVSEALMEELHKEVHGSEHALIYVDNLRDIEIDNLDEQPLFNMIREFKKKDPHSVYPIMSWPDEVKDTMPKEMTNILPRDLFPIIKNVPPCDIVKQTKIWEKIHFTLGHNRDKDSISVSEILISSSKVYSFEFDTYIRHYVNVCLLIYGKLVSFDELRRIGVF